MNAYIVAASRSAVGKATRGGFIGVISMTRQIPSILHDVLILLPLGTQCLIASPHFIELFTKITNFIQLLHQNFL
jgi:hypothetical protein